MSIAERFGRAPTLVRILGACIVVELGLLAGVPWLLEIDRKGWDVLFKLRNQNAAWRPEEKGEVVHIDVNDSTLKNLGLSQLSRSQHGELIRTLASNGIGAQFHDVIFAWPTDAVEDDALVNATRDSPNVYHACALNIANTPRHSAMTAPISATPAGLLEHGWNVRLSSGGNPLPQGRVALPPFDRLAMVSSGLGFIDVLPDSDGIIRRAPLLATYNGTVYPSAALLLAATQLRVPHENVLVEPSGTILLIGARFPGESAPRDVRIPVDHHGNVVINFVGSWRETLQHYSASDVLGARENYFDREMMAQELNGKLALVSYTSTGTADVGPVAGDPTFVLAGVHAQLANTILSGAFLRELSLPARVALLDVPIIILVSLLAMRVAPLALALITVSMAVVYLGIVFAAFLNGWLMSVYGPLFLLTGCASVGVVARYGNEHRERQALRQALDAYFPPPVVDRLLSSAEGFHATGVCKELSILFSDIVGFTAYARQVEPETVQRLLNEYFDEMVKIVFDWGGTVDKFMGDGLMVFFGDPEPQDDHAVRCVKCAMAMQAKVRELRDLWSRRGGMRIRIRIGISTGEVVVGNMGSGRRLSYTVIGNVVNLAQRLEVGSEPDTILLSQRTCELLNGEVHVEHVPAMSLKGIDDAVEVYRVVDGS